MTVTVEEVDEYSNFDLENVITLVNADKLHQLLIETGYDKVKTDYLVKGFKEGFDLHYCGNLTRIQRKAPNLKLRIGNKTQLWNKVMAEVKLGRYAGPFKNHPPFEHFVQSPIGLVPKDKGTKTRLIFHLSYPKTGESVNSGIPKEKCSVKYPDFEDAVRLCLSVLAESGNSTCLVGKSDMSSAFRHVPIKKNQWFFPGDESSSPGDW